MKLLQLLIILILFSLSVSAEGEYVRGIYLTQTTLEDTPLLKKLIEQSKKARINTFVIDIELISKRYDKNIKLVEDNNIRYVARIIMFWGKNEDKVESQAYWNKKLKLINQAISLGAQDIQLDYVRFTTKQKKSPENAKRVNEVLKWFRNHLDKTNSRLHIDVFGEVCAGPSLHIGQDIKVFAPTIYGLSPMVYPSHYFPYDKHSTQPYKTIYDSLQKLRAQFNDKLPFKLYPFIEVNNFRYPKSGKEQYTYIHQEIKAVQDSNADGWYFWSGLNKYDPLFKALSDYKVK